MAIQNEDEVRALLAAKKERDRLAYYDTKGRKEKPNPTGILVCNECMNHKETAKKAHIGTVRKVPGGYVHENCPWMKERREPEL